MSSSTPDRSPKVLFIGGYSRSGSTLLDCMLGEIPGVISTGELAYLWTHGLEQNQLCGCGQRFLECPFWHEVGQRAFGGWSNVDVDAMLRLERAVNRHRFLPLLLEPRLSPEYDRRLRRYAEILGRIYHGIQQAGGARLIIDSTIDPAYGFLLRHVPNLDLRLVHLVRDSRATAFSWTRLQRKTDRVDAVVYQRRFRPGATALRWTAYHLLVHALGKTGVRPMLVKYENVIASPRDEIERIMQHAEEPIRGDMLGFLAPGDVRLGVNHTVAGSLMRLRRGPLPIRLDDEWHHALAARDRRTVTLLSWPLLRAYGYPGTNGQGPRTSRQ
ncbi:MAG: sulfotransferase [Solirubrobacteraceae bacterium]